MKSVFYITLLTLFISLNIFSQEKAQAIVSPEKFSSEHLHNIYQSDLDFLREFEAKDLRTTINKTLFDNGFLLIEEIYQPWRNSAWENGWKYLYTYDVNNNLTEEFGQTWYGSAWVNYGKYSYTYDLNNNLTEWLYQLWNGSAWVNDIRQSYTYDGNNNLTEEFEQGWQSSAWVNYSKYSYTYDGNNNLTEKLSQNWQDSAWVNYGKHSYAYDGNNNLTEWLIQSWYVSSWKNTQRFSYTYDGNNNMIEELCQNWVGSYWVNSSKYLYAYVPVTEVSENLSSINSYSLSNNYPNPFNPSTKITYSIPERSNVSLKVFDLLGSEVEELVKGETEAGSYYINFNASNLPSGVYFYQLKTENYIGTKKMILMR